MTERDDRFEHLVDGEFAPDDPARAFDATTPITLPETAAPHRVDEGTLLPENEQPSRHRLIGSIVAGLALLAGIGVVLALVFGGAFERGVLPAGSGFGEPASGRGGGATVAVTSMPFDESIDCTSTDRAIDLSWSTEGADSVAFYEGRWIEDGQEGSPLYDSLPASGDSADFPDPVEYPCPAATQQYTLVATAEDGSTSSRVITISGTS
jgi:hypothetical protein